MNINTKYSIAKIIGILILVVLLTSGCSAPITPSPTALPPTPIPSTPTPVLPTPTPDLIGLVSAYENAVKSHDLAAMMVLFDDSAKYQWGGWTTTVSKQELNDLHNYFIAVNEEIQNKNCTFNGSVVSCQGVFRDDCTKSAGLDGERYSSIEYNFENGKITKIIAIELNESFYPLNYYYMKMLNWVNQTYPEEYQKLFNDSGSFSWDQESGVIMSRFCQEYVSTKP